MLVNNLMLNPDLGIENVEQLHQTLLPYIAHQEPVVLDAGAVQRVHTAGLQLLHAFVAQRAKNNRATRIQPASHALYSAARDLALSTAMGLEKPTTGETP